MISKKTKYGLKALTYIARNNDRMVPIAQIAEEENIPHKFLESILIVIEEIRFFRFQKRKRWWLLPAQGSSGNLYDGCDANSRRTHSTCGLRQFKLL